MQGAALPELVVLDVMLPGIDGIELLRRIRADARMAAIPVVMATARGAEYDKIQGLDLGADYYLTKPFGVMELVSCVKAVLRRVQPKAVEHLLKTGGLFVNLDEHTVSADGARVELTYKEFELLKLFLSHPGVAWTREKLMEQVWGTDYCGETRTVDMHIRTLRQKLGSYEMCIRDRSRSGCRTIRRCSSCGRWISSGRNTMNRTPDRSGARRSSTTSVLTRAGFPFRSV